MIGRQAIHRDGRSEDADYDGRSLSLLKRIAEALDQRVEIRFVPARKLRTA